MSSNAFLRDTFTSHWDDSGHVTGGRVCRHRGPPACQRGAARRRGGEGWPAPLSRVPDRQGGQATLFADECTGTAIVLNDSEREVLLWDDLHWAAIARLLQAATIAVVGEVPISLLWHAVQAHPTWTRFGSGCSRPTGADVRPAARSAWFWARVGAARRRSSRSRPGPLPTRWSWSTPPTMSCGGASPGSCGYACANWPGGAKRASRRRDALWRQAPGQQATEGRSTTERRLPGRAACRWRARRLQ